MSRFNSKPADQVHFVVTGEFLEVVYDGGSVALTIGYNDYAGAIKDNTSTSNQKGRYIEYVTTRDENQRDKSKRFRFTEDLRRFLTRKSDVDLYGRSQYEFLKNHPACEGSPNGNYEKDEFGNKVQTGIVFKEMDEAKDARVALDAEKAVSDAKTSALNLDDETLQEVANIIGYYGPVDEIMQLRVVEHAGKRPTEYNQILTSGTRIYRAVLRKALSEGLLTKKGTIIMFGETLIGADEDDAVAKLIKDKDMLKALSDKVNIKLDNLQPKAPRKPPGRPAKNEEQKQVAQSL